MVGNISHLGSPPLYLELIFTSGWQADGLHKGAERDWSLQFQQTEVVIKIIMLSSSNLGLAMVVEPLDVVFLNVFAALQIAQTLTKVNHGNLLQNLV